MSTVLEENKGKKEEGRREERKTPNIGEEEQNPANKRVLQ